MKKIPGGGGRAGVTEYLYLFFCFIHGNLSFPANVMKCIL